MSALGFNPSSMAANYGRSAQKIAGELHEGFAARSHGFMGLSYDPISRTLTILGSSSFTRSQIKDKIERIFSEIYGDQPIDGYQPKVLKKLDSNGNYLVVLGQVVDAEKFEKMPQIPHCS